MKKHLSIRIYGLVQDVYFRASAKDTAEALGISGFVRNEPDGSVYAEAEGEEDQLGAFVQWCGRGPARAQVKTCEVEEGELQNFKGFVIRR